MTTRIKPINVAAHIPASPDDVFALVSDTRNDPSWCSNVESVEVVAGGEIRHGTTFRFHQHLDAPGRKRMQFDVDVTIEDVGDHTITWRVVDRFQERKISLTVVPEGSGSRITQTTEATFHASPGMARWVYPLLARRTFKKQFGDLAAHFD
jgi:Polyketide cyclase / dehydrase and lipid transport